MKLPYDSGAQQISCMGVSHYGSTQGTYRDYKGTTKIPVVGFSEPRLHLLWCLLRGQGWRGGWGGRGVVVEDLVE